MAASPLSFGSWWRRRRLKAEGRVDAGVSSSHPATHSSTHPSLHLPGHDSKPLSSKRPKCDSILNALNVIWRKMLTCKSAEASLTWEHHPVTPQRRSGRCPRAASRLLGGDERLPAPHSSEADSTTRHHRLFPGRAAIFTSPDSIKPFFCVLAAGEHL